MSDKSWSVHKLGEFVCVVMPENDYMLGLTKDGARKLAEALLDIAGGAPREKPSPPKRDDEACGIGGKTDSSSFAAGLRSWHRGDPWCMSWNDLLKRAEELEEKAKECDSLSENLWVANDSAVSINRQRDGLAKLVADVIDFIGIESIANHTRSTDWKKRLAELTKDSSPCT